MLDAFADREHRGVTRHHMVVDLNAAPDCEARLARKGDRGADTDRHDDEARGDQRAIFQFHALDLAVADDSGGIGPGQDRLAARFQRLFEQPARRLVELAFHQGRHQVQDGDRHAAQAEAVRRFESEQAAADHHRAAALIRGREHRADIVHVAKGDHARQILARHRDDEGIGAGRDQQAVIAFDRAAARRDRLRRAVDRDDRVTRDQRDAIIRIPAGVVDHDIVEALLAREHGREHDAVVIDPRLGAEDRHAIAVRIAREQFLDRAAAGHAVADHDQMLARVGARFEGAVFHQSIQSSCSQNLSVSVAKVSAS